MVLDNASTHKAPTIKRWVTSHPRFVLHLRIAYLQLVADAHQQQITGDAFQNCKFSTIEGSWGGSYGVIPRIDGALIAVFAQSRTSP
jgi:hypothetical protein